MIKPMFRGLAGAMDLAATAEANSLGVCITHSMDGTSGRLAAMHIAATIDGPWPRSANRQHKREIPDSRRAPAPTTGHQAPQTILVALGSRMVCGSFLDTPTGMATGL